MGFVGAILGGGRFESIVRISDFSLDWSEWLSFVRRRTIGRVADVFCDAGGMV